MTAPDPAAAPLRLTAPDEALATLLAMLPAPVEPRLLPPADARGRILAETIRAPAPLPAQAIAIATGWAVAAAATEGASAYAPLPLAAAPFPVAPGDAMPPGTDAVLPGFDLAMDGPLASALAQVAAGEGVRQPGEDLAAAAVIVEAGQALAPRHLPGLLAAGCGAVPVRLPRLAIAAPAGDPVAALLAALAEAEGATCRPGGAAPADVMVVVEGAAGAEVELALRGIGARPGLGGGVGRCAGLPAILVPDRMEDALALWFLLLRPALRHLAAAVAPPPRRLRLTRKLASSVGIAEFVALRLVDDASAEPLAAGSLPLDTLAQSGLVLLVPPGVEGHDAGSLVDVLDLARCP